MTAVTAARIRSRTIYDRADTPRLSGVQIKAPMTLDPDGRLSPSTGTPFTHILKPAGTSGFEALPLVEWIGLALAREAGFTVPTSALIAKPSKSNLTFTYFRYARVVLISVKEIAARYGESLRTELNAADEKDQRVIDELLEEELDNRTRDDEGLQQVVDAVMDEIEERIAGGSAGPAQERRTAHGSRAQRARWSPCTCHGAQDRAPARGF